MISCFFQMKISPKFTLPYIISVILFPSTSFCQSSCSDSSFRKIFFSSTDTITAIEQIITSDKGNLLIGKYLPGNSVFGQGLMMKLNSESDLVWSKTYKLQDSTKQFFTTRTLELQNGDFVIGGRVARLDSPYYQAKKIILFKTDGSGNLVWKKGFEYDSLKDPQAHLVLQSISHGQSNDILITCTVNSLLGEYCLIIKLDGAGNIIWSKSLLVPNMGWNQFFNASVLGNDIIVWGFSDDGICPNDFRNILAIKLDYTTSLVKTTKRFCFNTLGVQGIGTSGWTYNFQAQKIENQYFVYGVLGESNPSQRDFVVFRFDTSLNFVSGQTVFNPGQLRSLPYISIDDSANINFINQRSSTGGRRFFFSTIANIGTVKRQRKLVYPSLRYDHFNLEGGRRIGFKNNLTDFVVNYFDTVRKQSVVELLQLQNEDATSDECMGQDTTHFSSVQPFDLAYSGVWSNSIINVVNPIVQSDADLIGSDANISQLNLCTQISRCDSLRISGPDTLCVTNNFVNFTGLKNPDCRKRVLWQMDNSLIDSSYQPNDSTLSVRFKTSLQTAQSLKLYASAANCTIAKDTVQIVLLPGVNPLPPDTIVCKAVNIKLTPGKWGKRYLWHDGSTDSVLIATSPGQYTVQVETYCGTMYYDTINITKPSISLGADKVKCNSDTITLRATPGFVSYQWLPQGSISSVSDSVMKVYPNNSTQYTVSAQTKNGCIVRDTMLVNVLHSPLINLGIDTSFCQGTSLTLQAPASFTSYQWNDGSTTSNISINNSGIYWIKATDSNNCSSTDSITILPLYQKPMPSIAPKGIVCIGQTDTLRVAGNFSNYQWQNGSTTNFLPVTDTGTYWLNVIDNKGCKGTDTAIITKLAIPPKSFLPADTIVCAGTVIELKPLQSFNRYLWSNGSSSPVIEVSAAGLYGLQVNDRDNCVGKDSMLVALKNCPNKIFFPSAFTPNGDGRNEMFKPFVEGRLVSYEFSVYNRWGQVVFKSSDYRKGWNGMLGYMLQNTGAFVWLCQYQFSGEEKKMEKGTVMLIR